MTRDKANQRRWTVLAIALVAWVLAILANHLDVPFIGGALNLTAWLFMLDFIYWTGWLHRDRDEARP